MKKLFLALLIVLSLASARGQGTFLLDQYSSTNESVFPGIGGGTIPGIGQSFTPAFTSVDFVRLNLNDTNPNNFQGATLYVALHSDSMIGTVIGSSSPISLLDNSASITTLLFPTSIAVTPGNTYFIEPIIQSGQTTWNAFGMFYNYSGGSAFSHGVANLASDLWFQEGIIVPEPSSMALLLLGGGLFWFGRKKCVGR